MAKCQICSRYSSLISAGLGLCLECIRSKPKDAMQVSSKIHERTRRAFGLPGNPPQSPEGSQCGQCTNECSINEGQRGYCGLVENRSGKLRRHGGTPQRGVLQWYYDALPTNCVSWWFCPGCTGAGYPKYAHNAREAEWGFSNLAVSGYTGPLCKSICFSVSLETSIGLSSHSLINLKATRFLVLV